MNYNKMYILITGGSGLIGEELISGFLEKKNKVHFTCTSNKEGLRVLKKFNNKNLQYSIMNINTKDDIYDFIKKNKMKKFTNIIHAARSLKTLKISKSINKNLINFEKEFLIGNILPYALFETYKKSLKNFVFISSMYGVVPPNRNLYPDEYKNSAINYGVSKSAQIHLTKELAVRYSKSKIRVNSISFGGFEGRVNKTFLKKYSLMCPIGRMLNKSEAFGPVWFLSSDLSKGTTGHNLVVDGGWSVW